MAKNAQRRVALITAYNPGAVGPRYVAGQLLARGHDVKLIHLKENRAVCIPTTDFEKHAELRRRHDDVQYVACQHPGEVLYLPYPAPITNHETDLLIEELRRYGPDVVGVTMFSVTVEIARAVTGWIHQRLGGVPVIWGGIHCMVFPEDCLKGLTPDPRTRQCNPLQVPDIICTAEGEHAMVELMDRWDEYRRGAIPDVAGLWFVKGQEVHKFPRAPFETNLDRYAFPAYAIQETLIEDDQADGRYADPHGHVRYHIFVFTERGCPYRCSFCIHSILNEIEGYSHRIRRRSVDNVLAEVEKRVAENGLSHVIFHDEIFAIQKKWIMEFARKWEQRFKPRGITFTGYVHPLTTDEEMVDALYNAGLTRTGMGIQTGSERVSREVYERPLNREKLVRLSQTVARYPFQNVQLEIICDSPYETEEDRRATFELLLDMSPPFHVETFSLVTYCTTALARKPRLMDDVPWDERLFWNMMFHLTGTTFLRKETVLGLSRDPHLRKDPLLLEQLVVDLNSQYFKDNAGFVRPKDGKLAAPGAEPARAPSGPAGGGNGTEPIWSPRRVKRSLKRRVKRVLDRISSRLE